MRLSLSGLGLSRYSISEGGEIYKGDKKMSVRQNDDGHKPRLNLVSDDGVQSKWYVAVLVVYAFQNIKCDISDICYVNDDPTDINALNLVVRVPEILGGVSYRYAVSHVSSPCEVRLFQNIDEILETYGFPPTVTRTIISCGAYRGYMFFKVIL